MAFSTKKLDRFNAAQRRVLELERSPSVADVVNKVYGKWFKCDCAITSRDICHAANTSLNSLNWKVCLVPLDVLKLMREFVDAWYTTVRLAPDPYGSNPWIPERKIGSSYIFARSVAVALVEALVEIGIDRQSPIPRKQPFRQPRSRRDPLLYLLFNGLLA